MAFAARIPIEHKAFVYGIETLADVLPRRWQQLERFNAGIGEYAKKFRRIQRI